MTTLPPPALAFDASDSATHSAPFKVEPSVREMDATDRAFEAFIDEEARRRLEITSLIMFAIFSVAWIVGRIVLSGQAIERPGRFWLSVMIVTTAAAFAVFRFLPLAAKHPIAFGALLHAVVAWAAGSHVAQMSDLDGPFFYAVYSFPALAIGLPARIPQRVLMTVTGALTFLITYFGSQPSYWQHPMIHVPLIALASVTIVSLFLGHNVFRLVEDRFRFGREVERQRAVLQKHAAWLETQVRERTDVLEDITDSLHQMVRERAEVARELHDDLGQLVVGMRMELDQLDQRVERLPRSSEPRIEHLNAVVENLEETVRGFIARLRSPQEVPPLEEAIEKLRATYAGPVDIQVEYGLLEEPPEDVRRVIYRVVQEALSNARKHAEAEVITVRLYADDGACFVEIQDDGPGFDPNARTTGWGLRGMRERAEQIDGELELETGRGGTLVRLRVPAPWILASQTVRARRSVSC